jgi:hypothetical protein
MRNSRSECADAIRLTGRLFNGEHNLSELDTEKQSWSLWPVADGRTACCRRPQQPLAESLVDSGTTSDKKKPNEFWSEWQDSNLRPLRPERSEHFLSC